MAEVVLHHGRRKEGRSEGAEHGLIIATPDDVIRFVTPEARQWLREFFRPPPRRTLLPPEICRWLKSSLTSTRETTLVAKSGDAHLFVRRQKPHLEHTVMLLLEKTAGRQQSVVRRHGSLTKREHEVLHWLGHAKTDAEIAKILGIAAATVGKHLERIYPKLGVESRTAAATHAKHV